MGNTDVLSRQSIFGELVGEHALVRL